MKSISKYLKDAGFIVLQKNLKRPLAEKGQDWNNLIISWDEANKKLAEGYNIGLVCGIKNYICVDCDSVELYQAFTSHMYHTYEEETISGGTHLIYKADWNLQAGIDNKPVSWNGRHLGEVRCIRQYVVIAPSQAKDPNKKINEVRPYNLVKDVKPIEISKADMDKILSNFSNNSTAETSSKKLDNRILKQIDSDEALKNLFNGNTESYPSRSEAEQALVGKLISRGFDKETIFQIMSESKIGKWLEKPLSYRELTYKKGVAIVSEAKEGWQDGTNKSLNDELNVLTYSDYKNIKKRKDWIIEGLDVHPNQICMTVGNSGHFKSYLALHKAVCIASGKKYLDTFKVRKSNVLVISAENPLETDGMRMQMVRKGLNLRRINNLFVIPRSEAINLLSLSFREKLAKVIEENDIKVLFIDTINPSTPDLDDNSAKDVVRVFNNFLKPFAEKYRLYIEFLHHTDKRGRDYLGSTKWKGNSDIVWFVDRKAKDNSVIVSNDKGRNGEVENLKIGLEFSDDSVRFNLIEQRGVGRSIKKPSKKEQAKTMAIDILKKHSTNYTKLTKFVAENVGCAIRTAKDAVSDLLQRKVIGKDENDNDNYTLLIPSKESRGLTASVSIKEAFQ